jgi:flagellar biosynthesis protein FlhF
MKISKYIGTDMRQALRIVREQLGVDAVILSSRRVDAGVEVTAAIDYDESRVETTPAAPPAAEAPFASGEFAQVAAAVSMQANRVVAPQTVSNEVATAPTAAVTDAMSEELKTLRRILETQVAQLAWNDLTRRAPIHTEVLRELTQIGLTQEYAAHVVAQLPPSTNLTHARRLAIATVSQEVPVTGDRWLENGGCVALIGPTGVGKTTTLTKLAVRWVLRHGPRELALISADAARIGAHETIRALGQMLGAPVHAVDSLAEVPELLTRLGKYRLILIDTPGTSQRDTQLPTRLAELATVGSQLETALVISASTQAGAIEEIVARYAPAKPSCCVLTKVDEAASLGGVISVLTRAKLPISYLSEGQRVPEDLRPARALELVTSAVQLAQTSGAAADEDLLRRRFGDVAYGIA